jgi:hypothetical protein
MPEHDALYHRLFSQPAMVAQLLRDAARDRIAAADVPDLEEWSLRLLDSHTLAEVLRG